MPGSNDYSQYKEEEPLQAAPPNTAGGTPPATGTKVEEPVSNYDQVYKILEQQIANNPIETPEQRKKRERNEKWEGIVSGIGDAVSAVSNLYFTSQYAPNMYDHRSSLSEKAKARWDKAKAERDARLSQHLNYAIKLGQLKDADRNWRRQLEQDKRAAERDAIADARYNESIEHRNKREAIQDERYNKAQERQKAMADRDYKLRLRAINHQENERKNYLNAVSSRGVRGKRIGFTDSQGSQFAIYENVWKGSMQQVYDVLVEDMKTAYSQDSKNNPRVPYIKTAREKDDFVKQNWHRSPRATQIMFTLSKLDPATMTSEIGDDEEYGGESNVTMPGVNVNSNKMPGVQ